MDIMVLDDVILDLDKLGEECYKRSAWISCGHKCSMMQMKISKVSHLVGIEIS